MILAMLAMYNQLSFLMDKPSAKHVTPRMLSRRGCKTLLALTDRNALHFLQLLADKYVFSLCFRKTVLYSRRLRNRTIFVARKG